MTVSRLSIDRSGLFPNESIDASPTVSKKVKKFTEKSGSLESGLFSQKTVTKSQLRNCIKSQIEIYRLLGDGTTAELGDEDSLSSREIYLCEKSSVEPFKNFPCTHSLLEKHWLPEDYDLIFAKGHCQVYREDEETIVAQRGMMRFGCPVGISIDFLSTSISKAVSGPLRPIQVRVRCEPDTPGAIQAVHTANYGLNMLSELFNKPQSETHRNKFGEEFPEQIQSMKAALDKIAPLVEIANLQRTKPYICKDCKLYKNLAEIEDIIQLANVFRGASDAAISCGGCSKVMIWGGNCSILTCTRDNDGTGCLSATKTCAYCADGATGINHMDDCILKIADCQKEQLPLPPLKSCECEG